MSYRVLIPEPVAADGEDFLRNCGYSVVRGSSPSALTEQDIAECDALLLRTLRVDARLLAAAKRLKVIAKHGVGLDNLDLAAATALGIWVTNAPLSNATTVAEHTLALILALAKNLVSGDRDVRRGAFKVRDVRLASDLEGKTLGLIGTGRIGRAVARKAVHGFGMRVLGYDLQPPTGADITPCSRDEVFSNADFVSLHLPLTEQSRRSVGKREFGLMKAGTYLINVSRGAVVNEADLITALRAGQLAGAGLDVLEAEPPDPANPLLVMDNVVLTPHSAALSREATRRMALHAAQGVHEVLSGQRPSWPMNEPPRAVGGAG
jgi:D-3-phosphoglycerate dehydrogenase / 2-oxoglutarate reductase